MKKNILLIVLGIVTVICVIIGSIKHVGGGFKRMEEVGLVTKEDNRYHFHLFEDDYNYDYDDDYESDKSGKFNINEKLEAFSSIKMNVHVMEIIVEEGPEFKLESTYNKDYLKPTFSVNDGVLKIGQSERRSKVFNGGNHNCRVVITIPSSASLSSLDIDSNVGEMKLRDIKAEKIDLDVNVGEVSVRNVSFDEISCDTNVGEINIDPEGKLEDYGMSLSTDVGTVHIDGRNYKRSYNSRGNGKKSITANSNVGEINVR